GRLELGDDTAPEPAEGVQEGALDGVLGLLARAELVQAVAKDLVRVLLVEVPRQVGFGVLDPVDAVRTAYGRNCCQSSPPTVRPVTSWVTPHDRANRLYPAFTRSL